MRPFYVRSYSYLYWCLENRMGKSVKTSTLQRRDNKYNIIVLCLFTGINKSANIEINIVHKISLPVLNTLHDINV